jgi:hypothetical protein
MATFTKLPLSGSSFGRAIKVAATTSGSAGTTLHTTGSSASVVDELWLFAANTSSSPVALTIQWGGTTAVDNEIPLTIPPRSGLTLVVPGLPITGTGSAGSTVAAYAATANVITISGYAHRIT